MVLDAVIFDFGETIVHLGKTMKELSSLCHQSMTNYLKSKGLNVSYDRVVEISDGIYNAYLRFAGKSFIELDSTQIYPVILYKLGAAEYDDEDLVSGAIEGFYSPIVDNYCLFEDAKSVLEALKKKNLKIGLVSNNHSTDYHVRLLKKHDLESYFDSIVVSSMIGIRKPHERIFQHCLTQLNVKPENAVFIGDHPILDIQGAKNAGMRCIWIKRKDWKEAPVKPDWTVGSLSEVEEIINTLKA